MSIKENPENNSTVIIKEINEEGKEPPKITKEEINKYFDTINEIKISGWESKLLESKLNFRDFSSVQDADILSEEFNDKKTSKIIKGDIERTKVLEREYMDSFKDYLFQFIVYYINKNKILYKQGLNEIAGPFILLKFKLKISFAKIYTIFTLFIDKFLTNYFLETDFYSLKSSLSLINLLLRYHSPDIFHLFEYSLIFPELYATSWLLTLFSNKCSLDIIYHLWDKLILFDDPLFIHFFIIALLVKNKNKFFEVDCNIILSILSKLRIGSMDEVNEILDMAIDLRNNTPNSFYLLAKNLEIFNYGSINLKKLYEAYNPNNMLALPIFSSEIFSITYTDLIGCPDEDCHNFNLRIKKFEKREKCIFCRNKYNKPQLFFVIFDLRIFNSNSNLKENEDEYISSSFSGFLPKTITITKEICSEENFPKNILKEYLNDKEKTHFILMTSNDDDFEKFENEYYKRKKDDKRGSKVGIFYKVIKELSVEKAEELKRKSKKKYDLLMEYDIFKKLIEEMNTEGFKNVSFVYGGFKSVHSFAMKYNIDLLEHQKKCFLCEGGKNSFGLKKIMNENKLLKFLKK